MISLLQITNDTKHSSSVVCPHCKNDSIVKYGKYKKRQRYRCNHCGSTFNDFSGTFLSGTHHLDKWIPFFNEMLKCSSLRSIAVKLNISHVTAFYWRHKILKHLEDNFKSFNGIIELSHNIIALNEKGIKNSAYNFKRNHLGGFCIPESMQVRIVFLKDRYGNNLIIKGAAAETYDALLKRTFDKYLKLPVSLCTNEGGIVKGACLKKKIIYKRASYNGCEGSLYHIKNVISYKNTFFNWLMKFKGVSTKYLYRYIKWFKKIYEFGFESNNFFVEKFIYKCLLYSEIVTYKGIRS